MDVSSLFCFILPVLWLLPFFLFLFLKIVAEVIVFLSRYLISVCEVG
jgi:hypothetical protein